MIFRSAHLFVVIGLSQRLVDNPPKWNERVERLIFLGGAQLCQSNWIKDMKYWLKCSVSEYFLHSAGGIKIFPKIFLILINTAFLFFLIFSRFILVFCIISTFDNFLFAYKRCLLHGQLREWNRISWSGSSFCGYFCWFLHLSSELQRCANLII